MSKIERKLNLLLECWLSDNDNLSDRAIEEEEKLMERIRKEIKTDKEIKYFKREIK